MIYLYTVLSVVIFILAIKINRKLKSILLTPFTITLIVLVSILLIADLPYQDYLKGNQPITVFLGPSVVALALPLYEQLHKIKHYWKSILTITLISSLFAMASSILFAYLFSRHSETIAILLPKSITMPIAIAVAESIDGIPAITAAMVVVAGMVGSIFGYSLLKFIGIKQHEAMGLAIGSGSHALGTAACMEKSEKMGSYSSISLILCGIITSIFAPFMYQFARFLLTII